MPQEKSSITKSQHKISWGWIISGLFVLVAATSIVLLKTETPFEYYMTVSEFLESPNKYDGHKIKLAGKVKKATLVKTDDRYDFIVEDMGKEIAVTYRGLAPDTFKEGAEVVVDGIANGPNLFEAKALMAKCASKYTAGGLPPIEQMRTQSIR